MRYQELKVWKIKHAVFIKHQNIINLRLFVAYEPVTVNTKLEIDRFSKN